MSRLEARDGEGHQKHEGRTVVARNYLPQARCLPGHWRSRTAVGSPFSTTSRTASIGSEPFDVVGPDELDLTRRQFHLMATIYDLLELATAVKPWLWT